MVTRLLSNVLLCYQAELIIVRSKLCSVLQCSSAGAIIDISVSSQLVTEGGANARVEVSVRNGIVLGENVDVVLSTFNNSALGKCIQWLNHTPIQDN